MNDKLRRKIKTSSLTALAAGLVLWMPIGCGDDDDGSPFGDGGSGGEQSTGGKTSTGGKASTGGKSSTGGVTGAGGGPSSGGETASGGSSTTGGAASTGGATSTGGAASTGGSKATGGTSADGGSDGGPPDGGNVADCSGEITQEAANLCLTLNPQDITLGDTADLDGKGTLVVRVFKAAGAAETDLLAAKVIAPPTDPNATPVNVKDLPKIGFKGLPETVYVQTLFIDNPGYFAQGANPSLVYGMFIGGFDLNGGVRPPPPLRKVTLAKGEETAVSQPLIALRKFTGMLVKYPGQSDPPIPPLTPTGDGQGPALIGVFDQQAPQGATVIGGAQNGPLTCIDVKAAATPVLATTTGFFYLSQPAETNTVWFGGQVDDYGTAVTSPQNPSGAMVSLNQQQLLIKSVAVGAKDYSVAAPVQVTLTAVVSPSPATDTVHCGSPVQPDAGGDSGSN